MSKEAMIRESRSAGVLPAWTSVLAVVAHPDDESFGLGAILDAFTGAGARVEVLCLTQGRPRRYTEPLESSPQCAGQSWPRRPTCSA
jgi:LmbE family N-acetylglucosaminyl deacetylase